MRAIAIGLTIIAAAVLGYFLVALYDTWQGPSDTASQASSSFAPISIEDLPDARPIIYRWPDLFGEPKVEEPQPPTPEQPSAPSAPPLDSLGYRLSGTVVTDEDQWAIVTHSSGQRILRVGDTLEEGMMVSKITEQEMWVTSSRGQEMLSFQEDR